MMMGIVTDVPPDKSFVDGCFIYGCDYHSIILTRTHWFLTMTTTKLILINQTQHHKKFPDSPSQCEGLHSRLLKGKTDLLSLSETGVYPCTGIHHLGLFAPNNKNMINKVATATDSEIVLRKGSHVAEIPKTRIRISCICVSAWKCPTMFILFFLFLFSLLFLIWFFIAAPFNFSLFAFCFTASLFRISFSFYNYNGRPGRDYLVYLGLPAINA